MQVIVSGIALSNGLGQFLAGFIASKLDSAGVQIRLHGVGNQIHIVLLVAAVYVGVIFL